MSWSVKRGHVHFQSPQKKFNFKVNPICENSSACNSHTRDIRNNCYVVQLHIKIAISYLTNVIFFFTFEPQNHYLKKSFSLAFYFYRHAIKYPLVIMRSCKLTCKKWFFTGIHLIFTSLLLETVAISACIPECNTVAHKWFEPNELDEEITIHRRMKKNKLRRDRGARPGVSLSGLAGYPQLRPGVLYITKKKKERRYMHVSERGPKLCWWSKAVFPLWLTGVHTPMYMYNQHVRSGQRLIEQRAAQE